MAAFLSGMVGESEGGLVTVLAIDARRRCSSAKAVEAKGRLFGLSERLESRLILVLIGKEILRMDAGRLTAALTEDVGEVLEEGSVGSDLVERDSRSSTATVNGEKSIWQLTSRLGGKVSTKVIVGKLP